MRISRSLAFWAGTGASQQVNPIAKAGHEPQDARSDDAELEELLGLHSVGPGSGRASRTRQLLLVGTLTVNGGKSFPPVSGVPDSKCDITMLDPVAV